MVGPRIVITLVLAKFLVDVRGRLIDWRNDRTRGGIRLLPNVNRVRGKSHCDLLLLCEPHPHAASLLRHRKSAAVPLQCGSYGTRGPSLRLRLTNTCRADSSEVTGPKAVSQFRRDTLLRGIHRFASTRGVCRAAYRAAFAS